MFNIIWSCLEQKYNCVFTDLYSEICRHDKYTIELILTLKVPRKVDSIINFIKACHKNEVLAYKDISDTLRVPIDAITTRKNKVITKLTSFVINLFLDYKFFSNRGVCPLGAFSTFCAYNPAMYRMLGECPTEIRNVHKKTYKKYLVQRKVTNAETVAEETFKTLTKYYTNSMVKRFLCCMFQTPELIDALEENLKKNKYPEPTNQEVDNFIDDIMGFENEKPKGS